MDLELWVAKEISKYFKVHRSFDWEKSSPSPAASSGNRSPYSDTPHHPVQNFRIHSTLFFFNTYEKEVIDKTSRNHSWLELHSTISFKIWQGWKISSFKNPRNYICILALFQVNKYLTENGRICELGFLQLLSCFFFFILWSASIRNSLPLQSSGVQWKRKWSHREYRTANSP